MILSSGIEDFKLLLLWKKSVERVVSEYLGGGE